MVTKPTKIESPITPTVQTVINKQEARVLKPLQQGGIKIEARAIKYIQLRLFRREIVQTVNRAFKCGRLTTVKQIINKTDLILETKKMRIIDQLEKKVIDYPKLHPLISLIKQTAHDTIKEANAHKKNVEDAVHTLKKDETLPDEIKRISEDACDLSSLAATHTAISSAYFGSSLAIEYLLSLMDSANKLSTELFTQEFKNEEEREKITENISKHESLKHLDSKASDFVPKMLNFITDLEKQTGLYFPERLIEELQKLNQS